ncbi:leucyl/phenylalanyl-tRNA--protein transferase [Desulfogranum japonicum]|uniref:leucyl/phenylalanyl-tRNA--protein transferase n=1 Tax=Desulfogranum japonicum TaxID=231447 RepID=UPI00048B40B1
MPVFRLIDDPIFPAPELADDNGLLAIGGDLSPVRLLSAYSQGIFPWYNEGDPILWWSTSPRLVLLPSEFHCSKRLQRTMRQKKFLVTADTAFNQVITACAETERNGEKGTWITDEMKQAYITLHQLGFAHSIESWFENKLAGGLYGVCLDGIFFGESMFTRVTDASKVALATLMLNADNLNLRLVDCQMTTPHLLSMGARELSRTEFMSRLEEHIDTCLPQKKWRLVIR